MHDACMSDNNGGDDPAPAVVDVVAGAAVVDFVAVADLVAVAAAVPAPAPALAAVSAESERCAPSLPQRVHRGDNLSQKVGGQDVMSIF